MKDKGQWAPELIEKLVFNSLRRLSDMLFLPINSF